MTRSSRRPRCSHSSAPRAPAWAPKTARRFQRAGCYKNYVLSTELSETEHRADTALVGRFRLGAAFGQQAKFPACFAAGIDVLVRTRRRQVFHHRHLSRQLRIVRAMRASVGGEADRGLAASAAQVGIGAAR